MLGSTSPDTTRSRAGSSAPGSAGAAGAAGAAGSAGAAGAPGAAGSVLPQPANRPMTITSASTRAMILLAFISFPPNL
ncbi:MAG: hypothetical protein E7420_00075 [Ruminococcaceae bacterium]|nr:hypothetical protein [Oscillospiraceae bacterium]